MPTLTRGHKSFRRCLLCLSNHPRHRCIPQRRQRPGPPSRPQCKGMSLWCSLSMALSYLGWAFHGGVRLLGSPGFGKFRVLSRGLNILMLQQKSFDETSNKTYQLCGSSLMGEMIEHETDSPSYTAYEDLRRIADKIASSATKLSHQQTETPRSS